MHDRNSASCLVTGCPESAKGSCGREAQRDRRGAGFRSNERNGYYDRPDGSRGAKSRFWRSNSTLDAVCAGLITLRRVRSARITHVCLMPNLELIERGAGSKPTELVVPRLGPCAENGSAPNGKRCRRDASATSAVAPQAGSRTVESQIPPRSWSDTWCPCRNQNLKSGSSARLATFEEVQRLCGALHAGAKERSACVPCWTQARRLVCRRLERCHHPLASRGHHRSHHRLVKFIHQSAEDDERAAHSAYL